MANINKRPRHTANLSRHGHDLSQVFKFTSSVGQLLPVYYDLLNPNEHVRLDGSVITRSVRPFKAPAFTNLEEHLDWFFVPMTLLYSLYEQEYYRISDFHTSLINSSAVRTHFPLISLTDFIDQFPAASLQQYPTLPTTPRRDVDEFGVPLIQNAQRLCEHLGYSSKMFTDQGVTSAQYTAPTNKINPFMAAAYQAIFYSFYRLTDWDNNDPEAYNLDQFYQSGSVTNSVIDKLFKLHYRPYKKDLFTNVYPEPLVDTGNIGMLTSGDYNQSLVGDYKNAPVTSSGGQPIALPYGVNYDSSGNVVSVANGSGRVSTASLRGMFALEKLMEITRRAGKHVDEQTLAHFGVKSKGTPLGEVIYLGSQHGHISVDGVTATGAGANGGNTSSLGELAGNAFGSLEGKPIDFETGQQHGILMCIYSCVPEADYSAAQCFDKFNSYASAEELYYPEFDNLGMNPQFRYQGDFDPFRPVDTWNNRILAWQYRYYEYKQKYNRVAGGFAHSLDYWTTCRNHDAVTSPYSYRFYCNPTMLNQISDFGFPYKSGSQYSFGDEEDESWVGNFSLYDPFGHLCLFDVKKTSTMSTYSLASL